MRINKVTGNELGLYSQGSTLDTGVGIISTLFCQNQLHLKEKNIRVLLTVCSRAGVRLVCELTGVHVAR